MHCIDGLTHLVLKDQVISVFFSLRCLPRVILHDWEGERKRKATGSLRMLMGDIEWFVCSTARICFGRHFSHCLACSRYLFLCFWQSLRKQKLDSGYNLEKKWKQTEKRKQPCFRCTCFSCGKPDGFIVVHGWNFGEKFSLFIYA